MDIFFHQEALLGHYNSLLLKNPGTTAKSGIAPHLERALTALRLLFASISLMKESLYWRTDLRLLWEIKP